MIRPKASCWPGRAAQVWRAWPPCLCASSATGCGSSDPGWMCQLLHCDLLSGKQAFPGSKTPATGRTLTPETASGTRSCPCWSKLCQGAGVPWCALPATQPTSPHPGFARAAQSPASQCASALAGWFGHPGPGRPIVGIAAPGRSLLHPGAPHSTPCGSWACGAPGGGLGLVTIKGLIPDRTKPYVSHRS
jgi:hypothetical protein